MSRAFYPSGAVCWLLAACAAVVVGAAPRASAQSKTGTTVGQVMLIEPSARAAALGGGGVADAREVLGAFSNPAAPGFLGVAGVQATRLEYFAGVSYNHVATALPVGFGTVQASLTYLDSGEMDVRTETQPEGTGERFSVTNLVFGLGLSRRLTDRFGAGAQVSYLRETTWHSSLNAVAFNFGVLYQLPFGPYLGASLSNFGSRGSYDGRDLRIRYDRDPRTEGDNPALPGALVTESFSLPIRFRVGVAYPVAFGGRQNVRLIVDAEQPSDNTASLSGGAEWTFADLIALRGGYERLFQEDGESGLTAGAGLRYGLGATRFSFDYGWGRHQSLGDQQRFTLGISF